MLKLPVTLLQWVLGQSIEIQ